jgi:hypothetical protein
MFSASMSSALRMKCGNTLVHEAYPGGNNSGGGSRVREVNQAGEIIWGPVPLAPDSGGGGMMGGFNAAKIMYYPDDYPGIEQLLNKSGIGHRRSNGISTQEKTPAVVLRGRTLHFANVDGDAITICSLRGTLVDRFVASGNTARYQTSMLAVGTYIVTVAREGKAQAYLPVSIIR